MIGIKRKMLAATTVLLLCLTPMAYGDDMEDVKAAFDADIKLFNAQNATAFSTSAHDDIVLFGMLSPFAVNLAFNSEGPTPTSSSSWTPSSN